MSVFQSVFSQPIKIQRVRGLGLVCFILPSQSVDWLTKKVPGPGGSSYPLVISLCLHVLLENVLC